jgi:uncharacterized protein (DUF849 family)
VIKQRSNVVINITTGGAPTMTVEERVRPAATFKPEVASLNMGSMNFGLYPMIPRYKGKFKHDWEEPYLEGRAKGMFKNTFADIEYILETCAENNTRFEIECYDIGHLYTLQALPRARPDQAAAVRAVGVRHSRRHRHAPRRRHDDEAHRRPAVRRQNHWSVLGAGGNQMRVAAMAARWAAMCASAWRIRSGSAPASWPNPTPSRSRKVRKILEGLGLEIATPDEAREILSLKGGDKVGFWNHGCDRFVVALSAANPFYSDGRIRRAWPRSIPSVSRSCSAVCW